MSRETVVRFFPKSRIVGIGTSACLGLVFPMCECGIVPIVRRLMLKGVPVSCGVTYMLASPIINPLVMLSTMIAMYTTVFRLRAIIAISGLATLLVVVLCVTGYVWIPWITAAGM